MSQDDSTREPPLPAHPPPLPRVLNYGSPDLAPGRISILQVILGLIVSPGVAFTIFILTAMASDWIRSSFALLVIAGVTLLGVNVGAFLMFRNPSLRGLAIGLWIGLGILLLLVGACFAAL